MKRATTCTCLACQNNPSLDLKFSAHHGDYMVQRVGKSREPADTFVQVESYEHSGEVTTYSIDLHKRYDQIARTRRGFPTEEYAGLSFTVDFLAPPHVAREEFQDPEKRNLVMPRRVVAKRALPGTHHYDRMLVDTAKPAARYCRAAAGSE
jgi:hypothetical protein